MDLTDVFSWLHWNCGCSGRTPWRWSTLLTTSERTQHPHGLQAAMVTSITGLRCCLLGFSSVTLFFLFCPQIFESESLSPTTLKRREMKLPVLYTLLGRMLFTYIIYISLKICQFLFIYISIHLFTQSCIYISTDSRVFMYLLLVRTQYYGSLWCSNDSFDQQGLFLVGLYGLWHASTLFCF